MRAFVITLLSLCFFVSAAFSESPYQVADLKTKRDTIHSSFPMYAGRTNGVVLFKVRSPDDGRTSLWRTDGTTDGTFLLVPTKTFAAARIVGDVVGETPAYFEVSDGHTLELWRTDGSTAGTLALSFQSGSGASGVVLAASGSAVAFNQPPLDIFNVGTGGIIQILATLPITSYQNVSAAITGGNYFVADPTGLLKNDGTPAGTVQLTSTPSSGLVSLNRKVFFIGTAPETGSELWVSDGTVTGTHIVVDLSAGTASAFHQDGAGITAALGSRIFFVTNDGSLGVSDGTNAGTHVIRTGVPQHGVPQFALMNGSLYFAYDDGIHGRELWRSDGTDAGTVMVRDAAAASDAPLAAVTAGTSHVFYYGSDREHSSALFETDGTEAGTHFILDVPIQMTLATIGDRVLFSNDDGAHGVEPWISDGTAAGSHMVSDVSLDVEASSSPANFVVSGSHLFFGGEADDDFEVWSSDGSASGTKAILHGTSSTVPTPLMAVGNTLYLTRGWQLWKSNGEPGGESMVEDFGGGGSPPKIGNPVVANGRLYLSVGDNLVATDGTIAGTVDLADGTGGPMKVATLAGQAFFATDAGIVYGTDGTPQGTHTIAQVPASAVLSPLFSTGNSLLLFTAADAESVLWKFSGVAGEATALHHFPGPTTSRQLLIASFGATALFTWQQDSGHPNQLWKTDGTAAGTVMVKEFATDTTFVSFTGFVTIGNKVIFGVDDGVHGVEPWVSDGSPAGTLLLRDINPSGWSSPSDFTVADGIVYFSAVDDADGRELWQTDGTTSGTTMVADLAPGADSSSPSGFIRFGDTLYFSASTIASGRELWAYSLAHPAITVDDARAKESELAISIPFRLTHSSNQSVTFSYTTADDSARAGVEYTSTSGTLTFAPGETLKSIVIPISNDATPDTNRSFFIRLSNANAPIERTVASCIIEDDDIVTDLGLSLSATGRSPIVTVHNAGLSMASNVRLCVAAPPGDMICRAPFELASGDSFSQDLGSIQGQWIVATVTEWERDANPADNEATWSAAGGLIGSLLYLGPPTLSVGQNGTLTVAQPAAPTATIVQLSSSDSSVVTVPFNVTIPANATSGSTTFTAIGSGTATISAYSPSGLTHATVRVLAPGERDRSLVNVGLDLSAAWQFGKLNRLSAIIRGVLPTNTKPTGTVTFVDSGIPFAEQPIADGTATVVLPATTPGSHRFSAYYNGDANFLDTSTMAEVVSVSSGTPVISATWITGTHDVLIILKGLATYQPAGTISVLEDGVPRITNGPLASHGEASSSVTTTLSPTARTLSVSYSGDAYYGATTVTIPVAGAHLRAVGRN